MEFFTNKPLWVSIYAFLLAQGIKFVLGLLNGSKSKLHHFFGTGGMPSSHSATVSALATSIGIQDGFGSSGFAISAIFCAVVLYDATNIRRAAGNNANVLNQIVDRIAGWNERPQELNTHLGHTNLEVIVGVILGIAIALIGCLVF